MTAHDQLLKQLKDPKQCNAELTVRMRMLVLDPFKPDLARPESLTRAAQPTRGEFVERSTQLGPLAIQIVNQNLKTLDAIKIQQQQTPHNVMPKIAVHCLITTCLYAVAALRCMGTCSYLKPLDLEKTLSNLIGKMVSVGEHAWALDELRKLRVTMDQYVKPRPTNTRPKRGQSKTAATATATALLKEDTTPSFATSKLYSPTMPDQAIVDSYGEWLVFPMDATVRDTNRIMLMIAYQLNFIRAWCSLRQGRLLKYLPEILFKSGNAFEWAQHLSAIDPAAATKQFDSFYKTLLRAGKLVRSDEGEKEALAAYRLQAFAYKAMVLAGTTPLSTVCDSVLRLSILYEKAASPKYHSFIVHCFAEFVPLLSVDHDDNVQVNAYLILTEYYGYIARKTNDTVAEYNAFKAMAAPLHTTTLPNPHTYVYRIAYGASAELSIAANQIDHMVHTDQYIDTTVHSKDAIVFLQSIIAGSLKKTDTYDNRALTSLSKNIQYFQQSCQRFFDLVKQKPTKKIATPLPPPTDPYASPPRNNQDTTHVLSGWHRGIPMLMSTLDHASRYLSHSLHLLKSNKQQPHHINGMEKQSMAYVDSMVLLAKLQLLIKQDAEASRQAYSYLQSAEQLCSDFDYSAGYHCVALGYRTLGVYLASHSMNSESIYPLRKSCTLLEKHFEQTPTDENALQLCKRYDTLGVGYQKKGDYEQAARAFRQALRRLPTSAIDAFVKNASTMAPSSMVSRNPLISKAMDRFLRSSIIDMDEEGLVLASDIMNLSNVTPVDACAIYECELGILQAIMVKRDVLLHQEKIIHKLMKVYTVKEYPIRRARVLLNQVQLERYKRAMTDIQETTAFHCAVEAAELLQSQEYGGDLLLVNYRRHYIALAAYWKAMCGKEVDPDSSHSFKLSLDQWGKLLKEIQPKYNGDTTTLEKQYIHSKIDNVDKLYHLLRMLSNTFAIYFEHSFQVNVLRLMLKLANGLRGAGSDDISDTVVVSATLGNIYSDMGYSGKASAEFDYSKRMVESQQAGSPANMTYYIFYAQHLVRVGKLEESQEAFEIAQVEWKKSNEPVFKETLSTVRSQVSKHLALADAYFVHSIITSQSDGLNVAIEDAMSAFRILSRCANTMKTEAAQRTNTNDMSDPFSDNSATRHTTGSIMAAVDIALKESEWCIAQKMSACLLHLGAIHGKQGSWREALYFLKQGQSLGEKIQSKGMLYAFLIALTELHIRCGSFEENQQFITDAADLLSIEEDPFLKEEVDLKMMIGYAIANAEKDPANASTAYTMAEKSLKQLMSRGFIVEMEKFVERRDDEPIITEIEDGSSKGTEFECIPLQNKHGINKIRQVLANANATCAEESIRSLHELEQTGVIVMDKSDLEAASVELNALQMREHFTKHTKTESMLSRVLTLPSNVNFMLGKGLDTKRPSVMKRVYTKQSNPAQTLPLLQTSLSTALGQIEKAHTTCLNTGGIGAMSSIYKHAGAMTFLKGCLADGTNLFDANEAGHSAYYFEMANGFKLRREMKTCLTTRLKQSLAIDTTDHTWPKKEAAFQEPPAKKRRVLYNEKDWQTEHLKNLLVHYQKEQTLDDASFQKEFVDILPCHWTVCSLTMDPTHHQFYMTQLRSGTAPVVIKIPFGREKKHTKESCFTYEQAVAELNDILQKSDETIHVRNDRTSKSQVNAWWTERAALDQRMKTLLSQIESEWFGGFKGLLCGRYEEDEALFKQAQTDLAKAVHESACKITKTQPNGSLPLIPIQETLCRMALRLGPQPSDIDIQDLIYLFLGSYESQGANINYTSMEVKILKLKISSLVSKYHISSKVMSVNTMQQLPDEHVILILDTHAQMFPLESIPILRSSAVSRLPCLSFLRDRVLRARTQHRVPNDQWSEVTVNASNAYYVLNPSGDLKHTQSQFESIFQNVPGWRGLIEERPMELDLETALKSSDIYMYFGHSAGQSFIRGQRIRQLPSCAVAILMGCSSGSLDKKNEYNPDGYVLNYLLGESPTVVSTLWDVTDKSIDMFTKHMLNTWGLLSSSTENTSLVKAVASARVHSNLTYLIGASVVVYGVPCYVQHKS